MRKIFYIFINIISIVSAQAKWELNDVSYLFPLPKKLKDTNILLGPNSSGKRGILFPSSLSTSFQDNLITSIDHPDNVYQSLKAVGIRIDNCFKFTNSTTEKCNPQIRIVWQPIADIGTTEVRSYDGAFHTFYSLTEVEFIQLTKSLKYLKNKYEINTFNKTLGIHPGFSIGKSKKFAQELQQIILSKIGSKNLVRFTFMRLVSENIWWSFGGMDKNKNGDWDNLLIPRLGEDDIKQDFFNDDFLEKVGMRGSIVPSMHLEENNLSSLVTGFNNNEEAKLNFQNAINSINKFENPKIFQSSNLDCVHCHIAEPTLTWIELKFPKVVSKIDRNEFKYAQDFSGRHNLFNQSNKKESNKSLRAFGYFKNAPSINQRTINESAAIADSLNANGY